MQKYSRKQFLTTLASGLAGAALISACGPNAADVTKTEPTAGDCEANGSTVGIKYNHGHELTVTTADILAGIAKRYEIRGTADHSHSVELSEDDLAKLQKNENVTVISSSTGHAHAVTITCL